MIEDIVIRPAEKKDLPRMAELAGELVRMHHEVDPARFFLEGDIVAGYTWWFSRELERTRAVLRVASAGTRIVGYAYGAVEERDWNLLLDVHGAVHDVFVDPAARGAGAGRRLMLDIVSALETLGAKTIVLSTMIGNESAQRLFRSVGFRPTMLEMTR